MANTNIPDKISGGQPTQQPKAHPSGATDKTIEREKKFDEEGGDQPQAASQHAVEEELQEIERSKGSNQFKDEPKQQ